MPSLDMDRVIREVCDLAAEKHVALLPGAELEMTNVGIDKWTLALQRDYNKNGRATLYTTYQCYLRSTPARIAYDLAVAQSEGFMAGIKLVRGAYLASEAKDRVTASKEETDAVYDAITQAVLTRSYNQILKPAYPSSVTFPPVALMIASHNATSVAKARALRSRQATKHENGVPLVYAQLQGMADELSCSLVSASIRDRQGHAAGETVAVTRPYKCATWGTLGQCLNFLYRRIAENGDALERTDETRRAMGAELRRRFGRTIGFGRSRQ